MLKAFTSQCNANVSREMGNQTRDVMCQGLAFGILVTLPEDLVLFKVLGETLAGQGNADHVRVSSRIVNSPVRKGSVLGLFPMLVGCGQEG